MINNIDLSILTQLDLLELRREVEEALISYKNREKIMVYTIFVEFSGTEYYSEKKNAIETIKSMVEDENFFSQKVVFDIAYVNDAEYQNFCVDLNKE